MLLLATAAPAWAQSNFGTMVMQLKKEDGTFFNDEELTEFFNKAACLCGATFSVDMQLQGAPPGDLGDDVVEIWVGTDCQTIDDERPTRCRQLSSAHIIEDFHGTELVTIDISARDFMFPATQTCGEEVAARNVFAMVNEDGDRDYEHVWSFSSAISFDTRPPAAPTEVEAAGVEDGFRVSWELPSTIADIRGFQVLCASMTDGAPIFTEPPARPEYQRPQDIEGCTATNPVPDAGAPDAGAAKPQAGQSIGELDPDFICSGLTGNTATSVRVDLDPRRTRQLDPDDCIVARLVAVDTARNAREIAVPGCLRPQQVRDGWETYHDLGGAADGGFCFVATAAYGDYDHPYVRVLRELRDDTLADFGAGRSFIAWYYEVSPAWADWLRRHEIARALVAAALFPVVALAWVWNGVGGWGVLLAAVAVVLWRRRRRALLAAAAGLVLLAWAGPARAQAFLDERSQVASEDVVHFSRWAFSLRVGPYFPDIDGESGLSGAPFAKTYGSGAGVLVGADLEFFFVRAYGQLGLSAGIATMGKSGRSFATDPMTGMPTDERSEDTTSFRLVPLSLSAVYRVTQLADRTLIPLVPYARVGLSYYLWRFTKGSGQLAEVDDDEAIGGTLGWQATAGVALRADRLDPGAARALRSELGVEHAGFFFEVTYADVSGLGMANKLRVGDFTWAAGINFEF
jgi:hypothetical protein